MAQMTTKRAGKRRFPGRHPKRKPGGHPLARQLTAQQEREKYERKALDSQSSERITEKVRWADFGHRPVQPGC
jgi:hypothetical protein